MCSRYADGELHRRLDLATEDLKRLKYLYRSFCPGCRDEILLASGSGIAAPSGQRNAVENSNLTS